MTFASTAAVLPAPMPVAQDGIDREWIRVVHGELRVIAAGISDPALLAQVTALGDKLITLSQVGVVLQDGASMLAKREIDVLSGASMGASNEMIALNLGLSVFTVKAYFRSAFRKLDAKNRHEAVSVARGLGALP